MTIFEQIICRSSFTTCDGMDSYVDDVLVPLNDLEVISEAFQTDC